MTNHHFGLMLGALLIPIFSALTQWLNTKLMPQPETNTNDQQNTMAASMKSMNVMMPIMSAVFCFSLPVGMGIYWIAGAIVRSIQQVVINKHIDKMDIDEVIEKNADKAKAKMEKMKNMREASGLASNAKISTKAIVKNDDNKEEDIKKNTEFYNSGDKPGSLAAKANMVRKYNENNQK